MDTLPRALDICLGQQRLEGLPRCKFVGGWSDNEAVKQLIEIRSNQTRFGRIDQRYGLNNLRHAPDRANALSNHWRQL